MRCALSLLLLFLLAVRSFAATIEIRSTGYGRSDLISVVGELFENDGERFRAIAERTSNAIVALSGPGGNVVAGLTIGEIIRLKNFGTVVIDNDACASACALAWLGGTRRFMGERAKIGFHAAHDARSGNVSGMGNALVGAYLNRIGLPTQAVIYITVADPNQLMWLTQADAIDFGIAVEILASTPADDRPTASTPRSSLEAEALSFARRHVMSQTVAVSSDELRDQYAEYVLYYGKHLSRSAVLSEFQTFIQRWPDRNYTLREDAVQIQCFTPSQVCNLTAVIDWVAVSRERGKRSQGHSTWSLSLLRQNGVFTITSANGEVLSRRITDLGGPLASQR